MGRVRMQEALNGGGVAMAAFLIGVVLVVSGYVLLWGMEWMEDFYLIRREKRSQKRMPGEEE